MAVTKEQAEREARYSERNHGWNPIYTLEPGVLVLTKIDDALEGARNIDTPMILVSRHTSFSKDVLAWVISAFTNAAGEPIRYHPTHWRPMPADWPVRREKLAPDTHDLPWPDATPPFKTVTVQDSHPVLRLVEPIDLDKVREIFSRPTSRPIMPMSPGSTVQFIQPEPIAVFGNADYAPNFEYNLCTRETLPATVYGMIFSGDFNAERDAGRLSDVAEVVESFHADGKDAKDTFGLEAVFGVEAIAAEFMRRAKSIADDRAYEDKERVAALRGAEAARLAYAELSGTLRDALGDKGMEAVNAAISTPARL